MSQSEDTTTIKIEGDERKVIIHDVREAPEGTPCGHYFAETGRHCGAPATTQFLIEYVGPTRVRGNRAKINTCDRHGSREEDFNEE